ncbi:MAG: nucleoside triphosphate pyrophosphohydrolase [Candidatus Berkelbacteria bacterium]|nr:nucleoside triphosphate pyrophosphohydrolase [Candidatus Berkelbacteria bacterium]
MQKIYNKLIRDRIPEIIEGAGEIPHLRKLGKKEFKEELKKKVLEEARELIGSKSKKEILNEVVDIQELIDWLAKELKINPSQLGKLQAEKNKKRGSFKKKLFLISTNKNPNEKTS